MLQLVQYTICYKIILICIMSKLYFGLSSHVAILQSDVLCSVHAMNTGLFIAYSLHTEHLTSDLQHTKKDQNRYLDIT